MKITRQAQGWLWMGLTEHHRAHQLRQHLAQTKTAVESVCGFRQMQARVLALPDRVVAAADRAIDLGQHDVHPECVLHFAGRTHLFAFQRRAGVSGTRAEQAIEIDFGGRGETPRRPLPEAVIVDAAHRLDARMPRILESFVGLHGNQKRPRVLRAPSRLVPVALSTQGGVINLHEARQPAWCLALSHRPHEFVLNPLGRFVVHAQASHQSQGGHVDLGRLEHGATDQRHRVSADATRVIHLLATAKVRALTVAAGRTTEALEQARPVVQGTVTLRFGAVLLDEPDHRQTLLKRHPIYRHDAHSRSWRWPHYPTAPSHIMRQRAGDWI